MHFVSPKFFKRNLYKCLIKFSIFRKTSFPRMFQTFSTILFKIFSKSIQNRPKIELRRPLEASWKRFLLWWVLGAPWLATYRVPTRHLGPSWEPFGASLGQLEVLLWPYGIFWVQLGPSLGALAGLLGRLGGLLDGGPPDSQEGREWRGPRFLEAS